MDEYWASWKTMSETELHKLGIFEVKDSECAPNTPDRYVCFLRNISDFELKPNTSTLVIHFPSNHNIHKSLCSLFLGF